MSMIFGDADPEDRWDDGDPFDEKLAILRDAFAAIIVEGRTERRAGRLRDLARLVAKLADVED